MMPSSKEGQDVYDTALRRRIAPGPVEASPGQAATDPRGPIPPWAQDTRNRGMNQTQGGQYETGDPEVDGFLRSRALGQVPQDDPHAEAYQDPEHFERLMRGMYRAGQAGDRQALSSFDPRTPVGKLMLRAYKDGERTRGQRQ
jgi:hypothetical protein